MTVFQWQAKNHQGKKVKGEQSALSDSMVTLALRKQGMTDIKVKKKPKEIEINLPFLKAKVPEKEVVVFTRQFSTMINAGLPIIQCLDIQSSQQENKEFKKILLAIKESVEGGETLAEALRHHPTVFDSLYCNMVEAGETGGALDVILNRLAFFMEKNMKLKKQVKGALVYPSSVMAVAVIVVAIMMVFVIPSFEKMFSGFGAELPALTQLVVNISKFVRGNILVMIGILIAMVVAFKQTYKTEKGRLFFDRLFLKLPVFGILLRKVAVAKFTRTLGTMISSGVPILTSLEIVARTAGNVVIERAVLSTRESISQGKTIAEPLEDSGIFPSMVVQMISVGESTGALDEMLNKIADFYDDEVDAAVAALTSLIEPLLMVFLGSVLGTMIVAMYLPIFKLGSVVH
ncbi:MAG: type II secretion system F family protein [Deltaproteobacteria bacterium]|nr:type II secretion system F family protein [Candidatus Anaeroferrophillus wilburensis]MBN2888785.1 type II secretion system F family protein [Deltaproteobacteria bacterium]